MGRISNNLGNHDEAIQYYDKSLAINPNNKHVWDNKSQALFESHRFDEYVNAVTDISR